MGLPLVFFFLLLSSLSAVSQSQLSPDFYSKSCPRLEQIIDEVTRAKQANQPVTAAATLRIYFHDCMVEGCDASVLVTSTPNNKAERDNEINLSLAGDGFDMVMRAKEAVEKECPGVVSCADILALATRSLIKILGAPHYNLKLGRRDGTVSMASHVDGHIAKADITMDEMIKMFAEKGFNVEEMTALVGGGHTIGVAGCKEVYHRVFNYSGKPGMSDPTISPNMTDLLRKGCKDYPSNPGLAVFLDVMTPIKFDNHYFQNIVRGISTLDSDQLMATDPRTRPFVDKFAVREDNTTFFQAFSKAMEKLADIGVKTGNDGEIRKRCDAINGNAKM